MHVEIARMVATGAAAYRGAQHRHAARRDATGARRFPGIDVAADAG
jgi:hypothetical protein